MDVTAADRDESSKVSEDAILDSLFYACDTENSGQVAASKLIEYVRNAISNGTEEFAGNLDDLTLILDPEGKDMEIDLTSFQEGIREWISEIRRRSFATVDESYHSPVAVNCMDSPTPTYSSHRKTHLTSTPNVSSDSVEGLGGESPEKDWDRAGELMSTIEDLQRNNKRLMEQQNAIEAQMESTEEANSQLTTEVESLRKQLRNCQVILEKSKEKDRENAELRQAVDEALEENQCLQTKILQMEKERALFESNVNEVHEKLVESQTELDILEQERRRLVQELAEQKQYCSDLRKIQGVKDDMIAKESSNKETVIADLSSENEVLRMEKNRLESVISELKANLVRAKTSEHSDERRQVNHNGPVLTSTPFTRHSSLLQELQAQESFATKGLPSPMVGNQMKLDDSLDVDNLQHSWMSTTSFDSANTTAAFEKYSITAAQLANEFSETKEKALKQIDELEEFDKSPGKKDKQEKFMEQLEYYADQMSSLCLKKRAAEKRSSKLLATIKKLKEENKHLYEERAKAFQKLGTLSISTDEVNSRVIDLEVKLDQERRSVAGKDEKLKVLEQELSAATQDLLAIRLEKESLSRFLESQKQMISSLEDELTKLRKSQDEMEDLQTLSLVRIKELESDLLKVSTSLTVEKRRTSALEESIQLSVSKHSDELKEIYDAIPSTDTEALNRSRQSPRTSSPCVTGHMVKSKLCDYITQSDSVKRMRGVGRDSPDGKPVFEFGDLQVSTHDRVARDCQRDELAQQLENQFHRLPSSSISSDSLSPNTSDNSLPVINEQQCRQQMVDSLESPSGKFVKGPEMSIREIQTSPIQTQASASQTQASVNQKRASASQTQASPIVTQASASQTQATAIQLQASGSQTQASAGQTRASASQTQASAIQLQTSASQTQAFPIQTQASASQTQATAIHLQASASQTQASAGQTRASASQTQASAIQLQTSASQTQAFPIQTQASASQTQATAIHLQASASQTQGSAGQTRSSASQTQAAAIQMQASASQTQAFPIQMQASASQTQASAGQTRASASQTQAFPIHLQASASQTQASAIQMQASASQTQAFPIQMQASASQTQATAIQLQASASQTQASAFQMRASASQTEVDNFFVSSSSQTEFKPEIIRRVCGVNKETDSEEDRQIESKDRRRRSGVSGSPVVDERTLELNKTPETKESDSNKLTLAAEQEKSATSLWRKKLSVAFKIPEEFDSYGSATSMALENSVESKHFVDGVSLRVRPAPNEKEIEKQFKTLVLAFQTDQDTLIRRLEVQAHARDMAESNMNRELQRTAGLIQEFETLCITSDMEGMLSTLKMQVELLKKSSKRLSSQSEQHGCVQQESRMASGVEIMICHAENLSRHLERTREDLNELRSKERLATEESTNEPLPNGPTNTDEHEGTIRPSTNEPVTGADGTRQNSLFNFVMALHTTSMRAKDALRKFRLRTEASRQARSASLTNLPQAVEPHIVSESLGEESMASGPMVLVSEPDDTTGVEADTGMETLRREEGLVNVEKEDLEEGEKPDRHEVNSDDLVLQDRQLQEMPKRPGVCRRCILAVFRFTVFIIIFATILLIVLSVTGKYTHFRIDRHDILAKVHEYFEPFGQLIYYLKPPS